jgi:methyl halide transferase
MTDWDGAWREGRTFWDAGVAAPALVELLAGPRCPAPGTRALVPGCGSGWDVFALADAGLEAHGADLSPTAGERFEALRTARGLSPQAASIHIGDFFADELGAPFGLIWDYTFLCAIPPAMREAWAARMAALLAADGVLWTLVFPVNIEDPSPSTASDPGPPFRLHPELARGLLASRFEEIACEAVARSHPGREGKEWLMGWRLRHG